MRIFCKLNEVPSGKSVRFVGKSGLSRHSFRVSPHPFRSAKVGVSNFGFFGERKGDSAVVYESDPNKSLFGGKKGGR